MVNEKTIQNSTAQKARWQLPSPEELALDKSYAFTINAAEDGTFPFLYEWYENVFKNLARHGLTYKMYPEYSHQMKLHFHGEIRFHKYKDIFPIYNVLMDLKKHATFAIKVIHDHEWHIYCTKQRHIMKPYCKKMKKPYKLLPPNQNFKFYPISTKSQFIGLTLDDM